MTKKTKIILGGLGILGFSYLIYKSKKNFKNGAGASNCPIDMSQQDCCTMNGGRWYNNMCNYGIVGGLDSTSSGTTSDESGASSTSDTPILTEGVDAVLINNVLADDVNLSQGIRTSTNSNVVTNSGDGTSNSGSGSSGSGNTSSGSNSTASGGSGSGNIGSGGIGGSGSGSGNNKKEKTLIDWIPFIITGTTLTLAYIQERQ